MVSCQEPSPLKGSKHSLQHHPHDAALVNAHSFVSKGVEAMCRPCYSAAHWGHTKRQPSLCHCCPCHGRHHCNRRCHLCCPRKLRCNHRRRHPLPSPSPSGIAIAVAVNHCRCHLCHIAVSTCYCRRSCRRPLPSPSPPAIAVLVGNVADMSATCCADTRCRSNSGQIGPCCRHKI